jgi:uracil-DNA glycosylase
MLLNKAFKDAGIERSDVYLTNAVKHFKFEQRGKRRIHKRPSLTEVVACKPWLEAELALLRPEVIVCLGAVAALAVIGTGHRLLKERGGFFAHPMAKIVTATVHPSAILRSLDSDQRRVAYEAFVPRSEGRASGDIPYEIEHWTVSCSLCGQCRISLSRTMESSGI